MSFAKTNNYYLHTSKTYRTNWVWEDFTPGNYTKGCRLAADRVTSEERSIRKFIEKIAQYSAIDGRVRNGFDLDVSTRFEVFQINRHQDNERNYTVHVRHNGNEYQVPLIDCNHYNHAFNRYAKGVREVVALLGLDATVVDVRNALLDKINNIVDNRIPVLTVDERVTINAWLAEHPVQNIYNLCPSSRCYKCADALKVYASEVLTPKPVETKTDLLQDALARVNALVEDRDNWQNEAENWKGKYDQVKAKLDRTEKDRLHWYDLWVAETKNAPKVYDLYMNHSGMTSHVCGHENIVWLINKARELQEVLDDMTPNIVFWVRDGERALFRVRAGGEIDVAPNFPG